MNKDADVGALPSFETSSAPANWLRLAEMARRRSLAGGLTALLLAAGGIAGLAASAASAAGSAALPTAKERWLEARSPNYVVYGDEGESRLRQIVARLEGLRLALRAITPDATVRSPRPSSLYVFEGDASWRRYRPARPDGKKWEISGLFAATPDGNYLAIASLPRMDPYRSVLHEAIHEILDANLGPTPLWVGEGLAEYYSTFWLDGTRAEVGRTIEEHELWLRRYAWMPSSALFVVDRSSPEYNEATRQGTFYAQSWMVIHYFLSGGPERQSQLAGLLDRLVAGLAVERACQEALGTSCSDFDKVIRAYAEKSNLPLLLLDFTNFAVDRTTTVRPLPHDEVLARLGEFLLHTDERRIADAEAHFSAASTVNPRSAIALVGLSGVALQRADPAAAANLARQAVAVDPGFEPGHFALARALMASLGSAQTVADRNRLLGEVRSACAAALAGRPDRAETRVLLGKSYVAGVDTDVEPGIRALREAWLALPARVELAADLAILLARQGHVAEARVLIDKSLAGIAGGELAAYAREGVLRAELAGLDGLLARGEVAAAIALATRVAEGTREPALREQLAKSISGWQAVALANQEVATYNRAVDLARQGKLAEAKALLEPLAASAADPERRAAATALLEQLAAMVKGRR